MTDPSRRLTTIAMATTLMLAGCASSATPGASAGTSAAAETPITTSTPTPTTAPSVAPATDLSALGGNWIGSIENVRLNYATGDFVGGTVMVDGGRIRLTAVGPNGGSSSTGAAGLDGPIAVSDCKPKSCAFEFWLIAVLDDGTLAILDRASLGQIKAGAGVCGAPIVPDAGVVTITGGTKISFVTGEAGGFGVGSGTDPCAGASYQITWMQVLTKAP